MTEELDINYNQIEPLLSSQKRISGAEFESVYEVQTKNLRASSLVRNSGAGAATGSFNTGESVTVTLKYQNNNELKKNMGLPFVAVYTGTAAVAGNQIYPRYGIAIANTKYSIHSGFDYHGWDKLDSSFRINIENNSGTASSIYVVAQWKKLAFISETEGLPTS